MKRDRFFLTSADGEPYVPLMPMCENMGLPYEPEYQKLSTGRRWRGRLITVLTEQGPEQMFCIPLVKLPAWLASISAEKVRPELKDRLIRYQKKSDVVLWEHWRNSFPELIGFVEPQRKQAKTKKTEENRCST